MFGTICAGAIFTGSNPTYTEYELAHQLKDSGARVVFASATTLPVVLAAASRLHITKQSIFLLDGPKGDIRGVKDLLRNAGQDWRRLTTLPEVSSRTALLLYSSGTTGLSKACEITHYNAVSHSVSTIYTLDQVCAVRKNPHLEFPEPVYLAFLPLFHASSRMTHDVTVGLTIFSINCSRMGRKTYVVEHFTFPTILEAIQKYRISFLLMAPPIGVLLVKSPLTKKYDLSSVQKVLSGAAPLGADVALGVEKVLDPDGSKHLKVYQGWGLSEMTCAAAIWDYDEWDEEGRRLGCGQLAAGTEAMIVDDDDKEITDDSPGEVWLKAPFRFKGYWKNEKATRNTITPDGWLRTGDIATVDHRGVFYIVDRKKELIKVKGFQVAPAELEAALLLNQDIADAAVIGVPRDGGEYPRAYVVPAHPNVTVASVEAWIAKRLAAYKRLTGGVEFLEAIPKSASGKILRKVLRERVAQESVAKARLREQAKL
ncbi:acetyl-CoA synthetase-like protein [Sistotremastrum suecicum HHB10207 ss-3]|uniref:Acetyl-CoA synthetase-like protein n=1 Tax=Sistotremastrum suecicum HHB10207 ss-3 TaxID=1314776 RepID=A0A166BXH3_9AGAM|nr:acetyl-CoA synthetase-like protein [Sistotremastrum suecicum HHB10207 ss-3]